MHYLLQHELPKLTKALPGNFWFSDAAITGMDQEELHWKHGKWHGVMHIPFDVRCAYSDYWRHKQPRYYQKEVLPPLWAEQIAVLLAIWLVYLREQEYVRFQPVLTDAQAEAAYRNSRGDDLLVAMCLAMTAAKDSDFDFMDV